MGVKFFRGVLAVVLGIGLAAMAGCNGPPTMEKVLHQVKESYGRIDGFHGVMVMDTYFLGKKQTVRAEQWFKKPDKFRISVIDSKGAELQTTICNGKRLWIYDRQLQQAVIIEKPGKELIQKNSAPFADFFSKIQTSDRLKMVGREKVAGRKCTVFEITPKGGGKSMRKAWIDNRSWVPLRVEEYDKQGQLVVSASYQSIKFNGSMKDALFEFTPSNSVQVNLRTGNRSPSISGAVP